MHCKVVIQFKGLGNQLQDVDQRVKVDLSALLEKGFKIGVGQSNS